MKNFRFECLINGMWRASSDGKTTPVTNPSSKKLLANVPSLSKSDVQSAIDSAGKAFELWREIPARKRSDLLLGLANLIIAHTDTLAATITAEQGKPLAESRGEITYAANYFRWFSEEAVRINGDIIPSDSNSKRIMVIKQPIGVVAAITPWNFPLAMLARKMAAALAAGCSFIAKPAPETPLTALALAALTLEAGIPAGVVNVITGDAEMIGAALMHSPTVRKVTFTGSTEVGKILIRQSAETVKKLTLELGGNAPLVVCDDADISKAVEGAVFGKFRNAGQTCICVNRFLVHEKVAPQFTDALITRAKQLVVGDGMNSATDIGPLINNDALAKVTRLVESASREGAKVNLPPAPTPAGSTFFPPTVISNITPQMSIWKEEIFGPVCAIATFANDEEAIALANNTPHGLAAYLYSTNLNRALSLAERLDFGMVGINDTSISAAQAPFGGIKESGFGREGSKYGIDDYLVLKYLSVQS